MAPEAIMGQNGLKKPIGRLQMVENRVKWVRNEVVVVEVDNLGGWVGRKVKVAGKSRSAALKCQIHTGEEMSCLAACWMIGYRQGPAVYTP